jgi:hypothetical protein
VEKQYLTEWNTAIDVINVGKKAGGEEEEEKEVKQPTKRKLKTGRTN